jgi:hypothetical protein
MGLSSVGGKDSDASRGCTTQRPRRAPQAVMELQGIHYDGGVLSGRVLVGASMDGLRLDRRLVPGIHVNAEAVRECATEQPVPYVVMDGFIPPPQEEDLLVLNQGYWYGSDARFRLFFERGPGCISVELSLLSFDGERAASVRVRAERIEQQPVDGGVSGEPMPADAGM